MEVVYKLSIKDKPVEFTHAEIMDIRSAILKVFPVDTKPKPYNRPKVAKIKKESIIQILNVLDGDVAKNMSEIARESKLSASTVSRGLTQLREMGTVIASRTRPILFKLKNTIITNTDEIIPREGVLPEGLFLKKELVRPRDG